MESPNSGLPLGELTKITSFFVASRIYEQQSFFKFILLFFQANWRELFPCQYPVNPHMRAVGARFNTFDRRWRPSGPIRATTSQIAKAGFYYQGIGDKVKCWYCNGGLQHWERDDDPWTEHAKWFPT